MYEPCGSLPLQHWSLFLTYCEKHRAFLAQFSSYDQRGGELENVRHLAMEFGPFDTAEMVVEAVLFELRYCVRNDGLREPMTWPMDGITRQSEALRRPYGPGDDPTDDDRDQLGLF